MVKSGTLTLYACVFLTGCTPIPHKAGKVLRWTYFFCTAVILPLFMALQSNNKDTNASLRQLAPLMNIGIELAATVGIFGLIGWFIDKYAATTPFWFVTMLILGVIGGMIKFIKTVMDFTNEQRLARIAAKTDATSASHVSAENKTTPKLP